MQTEASAITKALATQRTFTIKDAHNAPQRIARMAYAEKRPHRPKRSVFTTQTVQGQGPKGRAKAPLDGLHVTADRPVKTKRRQKTGHSQRHIGHTYTLKALTEKLSLAQPDRRTQQELKTIRIQRFITTNKQRLTP
jgi:hypothetical protein